MKQFDFDKIMDNAMGSLDKAMEGLDRTMEGMDSTFDKVSRRFDKKMKDMDGKFKRKVSIKVSGDPIGKLKMFGFFLKGIVLITMIATLVLFWVWFGDYQTKKKMEPKPLNPIEQTQPKSFRKL